jgi:hypothetical protein
MPGETGTGYLRNASLYLISGCLIDEVNYTTTLPPVVHVGAALCATCSKNIELAMELILL